MHTLSHSVRFSSGTYFNYTSAARQQLYFALDHIILTPVSDARQSTRPTSARQKPAARTRDVTPIAPKSPVEVTQRPRTPPARTQYPRASMKHIPCKTFAGMILPGRCAEQNTKSEGRFVNCRPRVWQPGPLVPIAGLLALFLAAAAPLWAQAVSGPGIPANTPPNRPPSAATAPRAGGTAALAQEAQGWLTDLIKINTSNPPGGEEPAAKYVAAVLQKEGFTPEILEIMPGRSAVVARLRSAAMADPSKALLLVAHLDVVPADKSRWTVDPFGGVVKDGYIYGRGAIDDKGMLAANLAAFIALKRSAARLNRDVIFLATADEETSGDASIRVLALKYWDKFAAGFSINEGGNVFMQNGRVLYIGLQASEKVAANITVVAKGPAGHASQPTRDNAVVHLATAVEKIGNYTAPVRFTTIVRR